MDDINELKKIIEEQKILIEKLKNELEEIKKNNYSSTDEYFENK